MRLCDSELRRLSTIWGQLLTKEPGYPSQTRWVTYNQIVRKKYTATSVSYLGSIARSLSAVAVSSNQALGNELASTAIHGSIADLAGHTKCPVPEIPSELPPSTESSQDSPAVESNAKHSAENVSRSAAKHLRTHSGLRVSRFAAQRKRQEDRLLINQLLKDKGQLSYDWRIPLRMLEHYTSPEFSKVEARHDDHRTDTLADESANALYDEEASSNIRRVSSDTSTLRVMRVVSRDRSHTDLARNVPRPSVWTVPALANYIEEVALTQYAKDKIPQTPSSNTEPSSNRAEVIRILDKIFDSYYLKRYLSVQAYNTALTFYFNQGLISKARFLFDQMEDLGFSIPRETFNILLRGAASSKDLHNYTFILSKSLQRGFRPDAETWNSLLMAITSDEVRAIVTQKMWESGKLGVWSGKGGAMKPIVQNELKSHVERRIDRGAFLDHLDERYGPGWLTTSTGNKILHEFSRVYGVPEALALLPGLTQRGFVADHVSLDTLLQHCLLLKQHKNAIDVLRHFDHSFVLEPVRTAHEILFLMAWRDHLLNFARIVWRHACIRGYTTFKMRNYVFKSLLENDTAHEGSSRSLRYRQLVGRFVISSIKPHGFKDSSLILDQNSKSRHSLVRLAKDRLYHDLHLAQTNNITPDLGSRLLDALALDEKWAAEKTPETATLQQLCQDGVQMDIRRMVAEQRRRKSVRSRGLPKGRSRRRVGIGRKSPRIKFVEAPVKPGVFPILRKHTSGSPVRNIRTAQPSVYRLCKTSISPSVEKTPLTAAEASSEASMTPQHPDKMDQCTSGNSETQKRPNIRRYLVQPSPSPTMDPPAPPVFPKIRKHVFKGRRSPPSSLPTAHGSKSPATQNSKERPVGPQGAPKPSSERENRSHRRPVRQARTLHEPEETARLLDSLDDLLGVNENASEDVGGESA